MRTVSSIKRETLEVLKKDCQEKLDIYMHKRKIADEKKKLKEFELYRGKCEAYNEVLDMIDLALERLAYN